MIQNIDSLKEILNQKNPIDILYAIGHENSAPHRSGGEIRDFCPIHGGDKQRSLAIQESNGVFVCHNCNAKGGDNIELYKSAKNCDFITAVKELASHFGMYLENKETTLSEGKNLQSSRTRAAEIWRKSKTEGTHPYFKKKNIESVFGVRYGYDEKGNEAIIVPYFDITGTLQAIQYINGNAAPNKFFAKGTTFSQTFFNLGRINGSRTVYLCEGLVTAASVWISENKAITTLSCGSACNIPKVASAIKEKYPQIKLVVCLDDDKAGDLTAESIINLEICDISFRRPNFYGLPRGEKDKDFNDLHKLGGVEKVKEDLKKEWIPPNPMIHLGKVSLNSTAQYYQKRPDGIDIGLVVDEEPVDLPSGALTTFAAPTKHGKTLALINICYLAIAKNPNIDVVFITLEELIHPICLKFLNRHIGMILSKNNIKSLSYYFKHIYSEKRRYEMFSEINIQEFERKKNDFSSQFLENNRLRILDFNHMEGTLDTFASLEKQIQEIKKYLPRVGMIALDYLQLMNLSKYEKISRDEALKEICLGLKNLSATTGLPIITSAQFNRQVLNEEALHGSAIGEGGAIERQSSLVFGMYNRTFPQFEKIGFRINKPKANEILLNIMLNRNGPSQQKVVIPYNGNIGKIDFDQAKKYEEEHKQNLNNNVDKAMLKHSQRFGDDEDL